MGSRSEESPEATRPFLSSFLSLCLAPFPHGGLQSCGGEDEGLVAEPDPLLGDRLGQALQFFEGEMVVDVHGGTSGIGRDPSPCPTREAGGTLMQQISGKTVSI